MMTLIWSCQYKSSNSLPNPPQKQAVDTLIQKAISARKFAPQTIVDIADNVITISKDANYFEGEIQGLYQKAIGYFFQTQYEKAIENCHFVLEKLESSPSLDSLKHFKCESGFKISKEK